MKKKILALLLAILAVCPLLVACGGHYKYDTYQDFIVLGDPDSISLKKSDIDNGVLGMYHDYFEDEITAKTLVSTAVASGEVKYGDTVQIDYKGYKIGETEPFSGGTATDYELEIGSGQFIDGFESGLIGHVVGENVRLYLNFPENYKTADLAGKRVYFDVTIDKITKRYEYKPMSDEIIKEQSGGKYATVAAFEEDARKTVIKNLVWSKFYEKCQVAKWPSKELRKYYDTALDNLKDQAMIYGGLDYYASQMGYTNGENLRSYVMQQARQQCKQDIMVLAFIEKYDLEPSKDVLEKMMKDLYEEAKASGFEGSYRKYLKEYDESAVRISAYTDIMVDYLVQKYKTEDIFGKNGFYTVKSGTASLVYYYVNDVKQTGWHEIDLEQDGVKELYYFNENEKHLGLAYCNIDAKVPTRENREIEKYHRFAENGRCVNDALNNELIFDGNGYLYLKDFVPVTGKQELNLTDAVEGNETYIFTNAGYRLDKIYFTLKGISNNGIIKLWDIDGVDNSIFEEFEGGIYKEKYYDFGVDGIFDPTKNGLAGGDTEEGLIIDGKWYIKGDLQKSVKYTDKDTNAVYYFDDKGEMVKGKLQEIEGTKYYFDTDGKMVTAKEGETIEITIKIESEDVVYVIDDKGVATVKPETPAEGQ